MSSQTRLGRLFSASDVDVTLAKVGVVLSLALISLQFMASQPYLVVIPVSAGSACLLYLVTANHQVAQTRFPTVYGSVGGYLPSLVLAGLAAFVLVVALAGERTVLAHLLAGGVGACILVQVLLVDEERLDHRLVLAEIVVVALVIRLAGLLATPGYVGIDIWTHVPVYVQGIVDSGSLSAIADSKYVMAPIYHAYASVATVSLGSAKLSLYFTLGLLIPLSVLFVYGAGALLLPMRWALLAAALFAFSDRFIQWGMRIIPNSLGLVFFLGLLYFVTRLFVQGAERWVVALAGVFSLAIVFTHQVSTAVMLLFLGIAAGVSVLTDRSGGRPGATDYSRKTLALAGLFAINFVFTVAAWAQTPFGGDQGFLWRMLGIAQYYLTESVGFLDLKGDPGAPLPVQPQGQTLFETLVPYVELLGFGLLLSLTIVGGLVMIRWDRSVPTSLTYLVTIGAFFTVVFGFSIFGFRAILPGRWMAFLYAPMAIVAAAGLYWLFRTASSRAILAVVLVLAVGFPTSMVVAEKATPDSPAFADQHPRYSFTESELAAVGTIQTIHPPAVAGPIHTDHPYKKRFEAPVGGYDADTMPLGATGAISDRPIVYREYQSTGPVTWLIPGSESGAIWSHSPAASDVCQPTRNVVYGNGDVRLCQPTAVTSEGDA